MPTGGSLIACARTGDRVGNYLTLGVGNYVIAPLGNCLTLSRFRLGNYLIVDTLPHLQKYD